MPSRPPAAPAAAADVVVALLGAFAVAVPAVRFGYGFGPYDSQRVAVVAVLAVAALAALTRSGRASLARAAWRPAVALAVGAALGLGAISAARAALPLYAFAEVGTIAALVAAAALVAGRWAETDARPVVEGVVLAAATTAAAAVLVRHGVSLAEGRAGWPFDTAGAFSNRRFLNQAQVVMLPVLLGVAARADAAAWARWTARGLGALHVGLLIGSGGRATAAGLAVGVVLAVVVVGRGARPVLREAAAALVAGAVVYGVAFVWAVSVPGDPYARAELAGSRVLHFRAALRIAAAHPWLGVGPMQYAALATPGPAHPHNAALQLAAEWGLPAAGLLVGAVGAASWGAVSRLRASADRAPWRAALVAALVAGLVTSLADSVLMVPSSQAWAVLLVAALWAEAGRAGGGGGSGRRLAWAVASAGALGAAALVAVVAADGPGLDRRAADRVEWLDPRRAHPRFWQVGTIAPVEGPPAETARYWEDAP